MKCDIHHHYHYTDPEILRRLDRIEEALNQLLGKVDTMSAELDAAMADLEASIASENTVVDSVKAYIEANATAQTTIDPAKLQAFNTAIKANNDRLTALILKGTPSDPGTPIPPAIPTAG